jgi:hypothetical protein
LAHPFIGGRPQKLLQEDQYDAIAEAIQRIAS